MYVYTYVCDCSEHELYPSLDDRVNTAFIYCAGVYTMPKQDNDLTAHIPIPREPRDRQTSPRKTNR